MNLKDKLNIRNSPMVMSLRNLEPLYDIGTLINAIPMVLAEIPETKFVIAGKGSEEDTLKRFTISLGISGSVKFIGYIPNEDLPQYLAAADVYASTALSDAGIAASTAEAMACGVPVVITDSGENRNWIKNGESGFIVPVQNTKALAEKIIHLLKNPGLRAEFGKAAREIIEKKNNYRVEMGKVEKIYEGIIQNKNVKHP